MGLALVKLFYTAEIIEHDISFREFWEMCERDDKIKILLLSLPDIPATYNVSLELHAYKK